MAISKATSYQLDYSRAVIASGRSNIPALTDQLRDVYGPTYTPERADEGRSALSFYCDLLDQVTGEYETAATALSQELTEDIIARDQRSDASRQLARLLRGCRSRIRENLGDDALRIYRLDQSSPLGQEALRRYGAEVVSLLEQNPRTVDDMFGDSFTTAALAAKLGPAVDALRDDLNAVAKEERETQSARANRNQVEARFRLTVINVASILEAHMRLAGLIEQADRIRPTYARATGERAMPETDSSTGVDTGEPTDQ